MPFIRAGVEPTSDATTECFGVVRLSLFAKADFKNPLLALVQQTVQILFSRARLACVAGVRRGGKGERRASEAREDRTREDRARGIQLPSPSCPHFDFLPPFIRPDTQANLESLFMSIFQAWSNYVYMNRCYSSVRAEKSYIVFTTTIVSFNIAERCYVYRLFCEATIK